MHTDSAPFVWMNGRLLPGGEAHLPLSDRGFRYGDGLFETLRVTEGAPEFWDAHVARLRMGMQALRFPPLPFDLRAAARDLLEANACRNGVLRIALSRGASGRGYLPPREAVPTLILETAPLPTPFATLALWHATLRRPGPEHLPTACKTSNALGSVLARMEAEAQACGEALLTDRHGHVSECSGANLIWQMPDGGLHTPALATGALAGTARGALLNAMPIAECRAPLDTLRDATAIIACNALHHAVPVASLAPQGWAWESAALAVRANCALAEAAQVSRAEFPCA